MEEMIWERNLKEQELRRKNMNAKLQEQTLQQMHNMNMAMLQQQQQQTQTLLTLLQKFASK